MEHRSVTFQAGCSLSLPASTVGPRSSTKQIEKKSEKKLKINFLKKIQTAPRTLHGIPAGNAYSLIAPQCGQAPFDPIFRPQLPQR